MSAGKRWNRAELLVALNLYHKLSFGQLHARNPVVVSVAHRLHRTPGSLAMKLCNLASLDPLLKARGIQGLKGASTLDRLIWNEFHERLDEMAPASENALRELFGVGDEDGVVEVVSSEGVVISGRRRPEVTEVDVNRKQRRGQEYFRNSVLNNFGGRCGVSGFPIRELLVASHILPWHSHPTERLNPRNGLALSRLHDAAFDRGLIAFDDQLRLLLSPRLREELADRFVEVNFGDYSGEQLRIPEDGHPPDLSFIAEHRKSIFRRR